MPTRETTSHSDAVAVHLANIADNLQLVADLGYGDVALAVPGEGGVLRVVADARPVTAIAAVASTRVGRPLRHDDEPEVYRSFAEGLRVEGTRRRSTRGIAYTSVAYPVGPPDSPYAAVLRGLAEQVVEAPGQMESVFMDSAERLLSLLLEGPMLRVGTGEPFSTVRGAGDGLLRIDDKGIVTYASPNAVNIMRLAGLEASPTGRPSSGLPGSQGAIAPVLGLFAGLATEVPAIDRVLLYRSIGLADGAVVLVEDVTEARRREQEIKVKEATIREVHHRVKNNLQTIASLLRIQARRSRSEEARRALAEAMERVSSMAVVHELLAGSTQERIDFTEAAQTVVDMVRRGLSGESPGVRVQVQGSTGLVPAQVATSLALVTAELVHNAIEHGLAGRDIGTVTVLMRRLAREVIMSVTDNGGGLPPGFNAESDANLGLAIVRTVVTDDLRGSIEFSSGPGTTVTVRFPLPDPQPPAASEPPMPTAPEPPAPTTPDPEE